MKFSERQARARELKEMATQFFRRENGERFTVASVTAQGGGMYHIHLERRSDWRKMGWGFDGSTDEMARKEFRAILNSIDDNINALDVLSS